MRFPTSEEEVTQVMSGFKKLAVIPYCVGAIDVTHILWNFCPSDHFYEYLCYKVLASIVLFACCTSNRRFTLVYIRRPGVLGDSSIFERSMLKNISMARYRDHRHEHFGSQGAPVPDG